MSKFRKMEEGTSSNFDGFFAGYRVHAFILLYGEYYNA